MNDNYYDIYDEPYDEQTQSSAASRAREKRTAAYEAKRYKVDNAQKIKKFVDGDTLVTQGIFDQIPTIHRKAGGVDTAETEHGSHSMTAKEQARISSQKPRVAEAIGKPVTQVTNQDVYDFGEKEKVRLMVEATTGKEFNDKFDLTPGAKIDGSGYNIDSEVNTIDTDKYGRKITSFGVNPAAPTPEEIAKAKLAGEPVPQTPEGQFNLNQAALDRGAVSDYALENGKYGKGLTGHNVVDARIEEHYNKQEIKSRANLLADELYQRENLLLEGAKQGVTIYGDMFVGLADLGLDGTTVLSKYFADKTGVLDKIHESYPDNGFLEKDKDGNSQLTDFALANIGTVRRKDGSLNNVALEDSRERLNEMIGLDNRFSERDREELVSNVIDVWDNEESNIFEKLLKTPEPVIRGIIKDPTIAFGVATESYGFVRAMGFGALKELGTMKKTGILAKGARLLGMGGNKAQNMAMATSKGTAAAKAGSKTSQAAMKRLGVNSTARAAALEAKITAEVGKVAKSTQVVTARGMPMIASEANQVLEKRHQETGRFATPLEVVGVVATAAIQMHMDALVDGAIFKGFGGALKDTISKSFKTTSKTEARRIIKGIGLSAAKAVGAGGAVMATEAATEMIQESITMYSERFGIDKYTKQDYLGMFNEKERNQIITSGVLGAVGGLGMSSISIGSKLVTDTKDAITGGELGEAAKIPGRIYGMVSGQREKKYDNASSEYLKKDKEVVTGYSEALDGQHEKEIARGRKPLEVLREGINRLRASSEKESPIVDARNLNRLLRAYAIKVYDKDSDKVDDAQFQELLKEIDKDSSLSVLFDKKNFSKDVINDTLDDMIDEQNKRYEGMSADDINARFQLVDHMFGSIGMNEEELKDARKDIDLARKQFEDYQNRGLKKTADKNMEDVDKEAEDIGFIDVGDGGVLLKPVRTHVNDIAADIDTEQTKTKNIDSFIDFATSRIDKLFNERYEKSGSHSPVFLKNVRVTNSKLVAGRDKIAALVKAMPAGELKKQYEAKIATFDERIAKSEEYISEMMKDEGPIQRTDTFARQSAEQKRTGSRKGTTNRTRKKDVDTIDGIPVSSKLDATQEAEIVKGQTKNKSKKAKLPGYMKTEVGKRRFHVLFGSVDGSDHIKSVIVQTLKGTAKTFNLITKSGYIKKIPEGVMSIVYTAAGIKSPKDHALNIDYQGKKNNKRFMLLGGNVYQLTGTDIVKENGKNETKWSYVGMASEIVDSDNDTIQNILASNQKDKFLDYFKKENKGKNDIETLMRDNARKYVDKNVEKVEEETPTQSELFDEDTETEPKKEEKKKETTKKEKMSPTQRQKIIDETPVVHEDPTIQRLFMDAAIAKQYRKKAIAWRDAVKKWKNSANKTEKLAEAEAKYKSAKEKETAAFQALKKAMPESDNKTRNVGVKEVYDYFQANSLTSIGKPKTKVKITTPKTLSDLFEDEEVDRAKEEIVTEELVIESKPVTMPTKDMETNEEIQVTLEAIETLKEQLKESKEPESTAYAKKNRMLKKFELDVAMLKKQAKSTITKKEKALEEADSLVEAAQERDAELEVIEQEKIRKEQEEAAVEAREFLESISKDDLITQNKEEIEESDKKITKLESEIEEVKKDLKSLDNEFKKQRMVETVSEIERYMEELFQAISSGNYTEALLLEEALYETVNLLPKSAQGLYGGKIKHIMNLINSEKPNQNKILDAFDVLDAQHQKVVDTAQDFVAESKVPKSEQKLFESQNKLIEKMREKRRALNQESILKSNLEEGGAQGNRVYSILNDMQKRIWSVRKVLASTRTIYDNYVNPILNSKYTVEELLQFLPNGKKTLYGKIQGKEKIEKARKDLSFFINALGLTDIIQESQVVGTYDENGKLTYRNNWSINDDGLLVYVPDNGKTSFNNEGFNALALFGKEKDIIVEYNGKKEKRRIVSFDENTAEVIALFTAKLYSDAYYSSKTLKDDDIKTIFGFANDVDEETIAQAKALLAEGLIPRSSFIDSTGKDIFSTLGLKQKGNTQDDFTDMATYSLGLFAVSALRQAGAVKGVGDNKVEFESRDVNKEYDIIEVNPFGKIPFKGKKGERLQSHHNDSFQRMLKDALNVFTFLVPSGDRKTFSLEPITEHSGGTRNHRDNVISKEDVEYIIKQQSRPWKLNKVLTDLIALNGKTEKGMAKTRQDILDMNGWVDINAVDELTGQPTMNINEKEKQLSVNMGYEMEVDYILSVANEIGSQSFYIPWDSTLSDRTMMDGEMNPQASKIHRFLISMDDMRTEHRADELTNDNKSLQLFIMALGQAFDLDLDKLDDSTVLANLEKDFVKIDFDNSTMTFAKDDKGNPTKEAKALELAIEYFAMEKKSKAFKYKQAIKDLANMGEHMHAVQAAHALAMLQRTQKDPAKYPIFKNEMMIEADAITSGMALTLLQIGTPEAMALLHKTGIYTDAKIDELLAEYNSNRDKSKPKMTRENINHGTLNEETSWFQDFYTTIGVGVIDRIKGKPGKKDADGNPDTGMLGEIAASAEKNHGLPVKTLAGLLIWDISSKNMFKELNGIEQYVVKNIRKIAKSPVMVYIYGATINSIKKKLAHTIAKDSLIPLLHKYGHVNYNQLMTNINNVFPVSPSNINEQMREAQEEGYVSKDTRFIQLKDGNGNKFKNSEDMVEYVRGILFDGGKKEPTETLEEQKEIAQMGLMIYFSQNTHEKDANNKFYAHSIRPTFAKINANNEMERVAPKNNEGMFIRDLLITDKAVEKLQKGTDSIYGSAFNEIFRETFAMVNRYRDVMKSLQLVSHRIFVYKLKKELEKVSVDGKITADQFTDAMMNVTGLGHGHNIPNNRGKHQDLKKKGDDLSGTGQRVGVSRSNVGLIHDDIRAATDKLFLNEGWQSKTKNAKIEGNTNKKEYIDNSRAVATISIHSIDARLIQKPTDKHSILNIYDAIVSGIDYDTYMDATDEYNVDVIRSAREWSAMAGLIKKTRETMDAMDEEEYADFIKDVAENYGEDVYELIDSLDENIIDGLTKDPTNEKYVSPDEVFRNLKYEVDHIQNSRLETLSGGSRVGHIYAAGSTTSRIDPVDKKDISHDEKDKGKMNYFAPIEDMGSIEKVLVDLYNVVVEVDKKKAEAKAAKKEASEKKTTKKVASAWAKSKYEQLSKGVGRFSRNIVFNTSGFYGALSNMANEQMGASVKTNVPGQTKGREYTSVEQAFHIAKLEYTNLSKVEKQKLTKQFLNEKSGFQLKKMGGRNGIIPAGALDQKAWNDASSGLMQQFLEDKFEQNPDLMHKLLMTNEDELTHITKGKTDKWTTQFPKMLQGIRSKKRENMSNAEIDAFLDFAFDIILKEQIVEINSSKDTDAKKKNRIKSATIYNTKDLKKAKQATQFIGQGKTDTSTDKYHDMFEAIGKANTGEYTSSDIVFVSANGLRKGRIFPVTADGKVLNGLYRNMAKAMNAGATIVIDTSVHRNKTNTFNGKDTQYNQGEIQVAQYLELNGYVEQMVKGKGTGVFKKNEKTYKKILELEINDTKAEKPEVATESTEEEKGTRTVNRQSNITRADLRTNPETIYLFGDNEERKGRGGQAKDMRGEPNAIGIRTKSKPARSSNAYWTDDTFEANKKMIDEDFESIPSDADVIVPEGGLGTGLAALEEKAPKTFAYLEKKIAELEGTPVVEEVIEETTAPEDTYIDPDAVEDDMRDTFVDPEAEQDALEKEMQNVDEELDAQDLRDYVNKHINKLKDVFSKAELGIINAMNMKDVRKIKEYMARARKVMAKDLFADDEEETTTDDELVDGQNGWHGEYSANRRPRIEGKTDYDGEPLTDEYFKLRDEKQIAVDELGKKFPYPNAKNSKRYSKRIDQEGYWKELKALNEKYEAKKGWQDEYQYVPFSIDQEYQNKLDTFDESYEMGIYDVRQEMLYKLEDAGMVELDVDGNLKEVLDESKADYLAELFDTMEKIEEIYEDNEIPINIIVNEYTTEGRTRGAADVNTQKIALRINKNGDNIFNPAEIILHETIHILIEHALHENPAMRAKIRMVQEQVAKNTTYEMFLPNQLTKEDIEDGKTLDQINTEEDVELAKEIYDYALLGNESEFMAYSMTHKELMAKNKEVEVEYDMFDALSRDEIRQRRKDGKKLTGYEKLINIFKVIANKMLTTFRMATPDVDVDGKRKGELGKASAVMEQFTMDMVKLQVQYMNEFVKKKDNESNFVINAFNKADDKLIGLNKKFEKHLDKMYTKLKDARGRKSFVDKITEMNGLRQLKSTGLMQSIWHDISGATGDDAVAGFYDLFNKIMTVKESEKEALRLNLNINIKDELLKDKDGNDITDRESKAIKRVFIDTGAADLLNAGYTIEEIGDFVEDPDKLKEEIKKIRSKFKDNQTSYEYMKQAQGLGYMIVKGIPITKNQMANAKNIYNGLMKPGASFIVKPRNKEETIENIDVLASLYALQYSDKVELAIAKDYVRKNPEGVQGTLEIYSQYMKKHFETLDKDGNVDAASIDSSMKGYTYDEFDVKQDVKIVREDEIEDFEKRGYTFVGGSKKNADVSYLSASKMPVKKYRMVGRDYSAAFRKGIINTIRMDKNGVTLRDIVRTDGNTMTQVQEVLDAMLTEANSDRATKDEMYISQQTPELRPLLNEQGEIVDYVDDMTHAYKKKYLTLNDDIISTVSNTLTNLESKSNALTGNKKALDWIINDSNKNYKNNPDDYVLLEPSTAAFKSPTEKQWAIIPEYSRQYIYNRTKESKIAVRKDLLDNVIGYRSMSIGQWNYLKKKSPKIYKAAVIFERFWMDFVTKFKGIIIVMTGDVIIANFVSNSMAALQHGIDPYTYLKDTIEAWGLLNQHQKDTAKLESIKILKKAGKPISDASIKNLQAKIDKNPINELIEAGLFSPIVEDINTGVLREHNTVDNLIDSVKNKTLSGRGSKAMVPVNEVLRQLYLSEGTMLYGKLMKFIQYGDITARYSVNKKLKKDKNMTEQQRIRYLDELFVNYALNEHKAVRYLNDTGLLMFTKYFFRSAKAIYRMMMRNPGKSAMFQGIQLLTGIDLVDQLDTYGNPFEAMANRSSASDPFNIFYTVITPNIDDMIPSWSAIAKW